VRLATVVLALFVAATAGLVATRAGANASTVVPDAPIAGNTTGFLSKCLPLPEQKMVRCYVRGLLETVEKSGNPAQGVPSIDGRVHEAGGFLEAACHSLMHEVGRTWAERHDVTVGTLYRYVPRSNDPGCSGGFGMGMAIYLGPDLITAPRSLLDTCLQLPTRFREYTCVHGAGHAFMRGFHGSLRPAVDACKTLGPLRAPDCSQGAFHDYWISFGGGDGTALPENADSSPVSVCNGYSFKRPCWYRYFWERQASTRVYTAGDVSGQCKEVEGLQRAGCVSGASLLASRERDPVDHARMCTDLVGTDTYNCLRGVNVPALANRRFEELRLIRTCGDLPTTTRSWCYRWFGRTLAVLTDGSFRRSGCTQLEPVHARASCAAGADRLDQPLRTFS